MREEFYEYAREVLKHDYELAVDDLWAWIQKNSSKIYHKRREKMFKDFLESIEPEP